MKVTKPIVLNQLFDYTIINNLKFGDYRQFNKSLYNLFFCKFENLYNVNM